MNYKIKFFLNSLLDTLRRKGRNCPSCGSNSTIKIDSKFFVVDLLRCKGCGLLFRAPTTSKKEFDNFYQDSYNAGFTTDLPSKQQLREYLSSEFIGMEKDFTEYIKILKLFDWLPGKVLLDYGCSWGYGSWQFQKAGFEVIAYDISKDRASFAREKLQINAFSNIPDIKGQVDIFFSSHVLEHITSPDIVFSLAFRLLKPGGIFISFTPNGSDIFRENNYNSWHKWWGYVHPIMIDDLFYDHHFKASSRLFASSPYNLETISKVKFNKNNKLTLDLTGNELVFIARKDENLQYWDSIVIK